MGVYMAVSQFNHVKISGIDYIIPNNICRNVDDYLHFFDNNPKKLQRAKKMIGYGTRYGVTKGVTTVDLCINSAKSLIEQMNIDKSTIDGVILVTQSPDYYSPASAHIIQKELDLSTSCAVFDVTQGCTGYVYGLWLASSLIESKALNKILLCVGDIVEYDESIEQKGSILLFSDAGCSTILEYSEDKCLSHYLFGSEGNKFESLIYPAGRMRIPITKEIIDNKIIDKDGNEWKLNSPFMDGLAVFDFTMNTIPIHIRQLLEYSNYNIEDIDFFAFHQANKQIVETLAADKLCIPQEKFSSNTFVKYGNTSGSSCLLNFLEEYSAKERVKGKIAFISFGIGLSWASAILDLTKLKYMQIRFVNIPSKRSYREEVEYWVNKISNYSASK